MHKVYLSSITGKHKRVYLQHYLLTIIAISRFSFAPIFFLNLINFLPITYYYCDVTASGCVITKSADIMQNYEIFDKLHLRVLHRRAVCESYKTQT